MTLLRVTMYIALLLMYYSVNVYSRIVLNRLVSCAKDNTTPLFINVTTENGKQYVNLDITLKRPLDETVGGTVNMQTSLDGKTYFPLCIIREKDFCKGLNNFIGELWYSLQRAAQIIPGACPVVAKRYYLHHYLLDFNIMTIQTLPFGKLRSIVNAIDNKNKSNVFCIQADAEILQD